MQEVNFGMYSYVSYGLGIHSVLALPELTSTEGIDPDITIKLGSTGRPIPEVDHTGSYIQATSSEAYLFWEQVGAFLVKDGRDIIVEPLPGTKEQLCVCRCWAQCCRWRYTSATLSVYMPAPFP